MPSFAIDTPIPAAMIRTVPQKIESPIPAKGPISDALTALIDWTSKAGLFAFSSSIAALIPMIVGTTAGVVLKISKWRVIAAA